MTAKELDELIANLESHGPYNATIPTHDLLDLALELREAKRERDALLEVVEWYANENHYTDEGVPGRNMRASGPFDPAEYEFDPDMGSKARQALAQHREEPR
jgi:hypothetical protein